MLSFEEFESLTLLANEGKASVEQLELLEPYRAKRAILLAAGFGSRMLPLTLNTPKPLIRINGRRIIESILDSLIAVGIEDIVIVRGYLAEEFEVLLNKYPMIRFIDNSLFNTTNNISSALVVLKDDPAAFENAYVFESDLFIKNPSIITQYQWRSNYLGVPVNETPDWCFDVEGDFIRDLHKGGSNCFHMYAISYWSPKDATRLAKDIPEAFASEENRQRFWDDVPCVTHRENYEVAVRPCTFEDVEEIDSLSELAAIDPAYHFERSHD
ncbi:sugar phosphate nucleotidyltransferase [Arabiibacter massiliensis]|uniref:sugar phosphate nucleotidyltransferase n=1 Tax=Arabiibacter massiliensis TaxID=1870985 RepID=UPI001E3EDB64|nr:sugar phosphate nucleotidyltransferase [Arabiibacter massiliensis]